MAVMSSNGRYLTFKTPASFQKQKKKQYLTNKIPTKGENRVYPGMKLENCAPEFKP